MNRNFLISPIPLFASFALVLAVAAASRAADEGKVDFTRDIRPIFAAHCFACHGTKEEEGGLRLDVRARVLAGGMSGPALVVGKPAESLIYQFVTGRNEDKTIMPPKGKGRKLTAQECEVIRRWIEQGAAWPDEAGADASIRACR